MAHVRLQTLITMSHVRRCWWMDGHRLFPMVLFYAFIFCIPNEGRCQALAILGGYFSVGKTVDSKSLVESTTRLLSIDFLPLESYLTLICSSNISIVFLSYRQRSRNSLPQCLIGILLMHQRQTIVQCCKKLSCEHAASFLNIKSSIHRILPDSTNTEREALFDHQV